MEAFFIENENYENRLELFEDRKSHRAQLHWGATI